MNTEMTKKVLVRAAELVERGWCQGSLGSMAWPGIPERALKMSVVNAYQLVQADYVCLDGALMLATHEIFGVDLGEVGQHSAYRAAGDALKAQVARTAHGGGPVDRPDVGLVSYVSWNDETGRTAEEVAAVCRKAAE